MTENTTKIITTTISASAGIITTTIIIFGLLTAWSGQWWVTPKHKAKALSKINDSIMKHNLSEETANAERNVVIGKQSTEEK